MSFINVNGVNLYYEISGEGEETILFSHGLLFDTRLFHKQIAYFKNRYRCVAYDHRGQGQSEITDKGYDMDTLTEDVLQLMQTLNLGPCHVVGLSMGGFVGMRLAARHPEMVKSLILLDTSADEEPNVFKYRVLSFIFRWFGAGPVSSQIINVLFGQKFLQDPLRKAERDEWTHIVANRPATIVRAVTGVIERIPIINELKNITAPTLVMVGNQDVATTPDKAERIHNHIRNSKLVVIKGAGHSSSLEEPEQVNAAMEEFMRDLQDDFSADEE